MVSSLDHESYSAKDKFGFSLDISEVDEFLDRICLRRAELNIDKTSLDKLLQAMLGSIPFHNLTLLTRGRRSPTAEEIKQDMLSGLGGPCGHMNPFLGALLHNLGFEVHLVSGTMNRPNCHLAVLVYLDQSRYYCDCGDGRPYLCAMPVEREEQYVHPSHSWKTYPLQNDRLALDTCSSDGEWKRNCTIDLSPKPFSFFEPFIYSHYTQESYGPFQTGFRLIWYPGSEVVGIRDMHHLYQEGDLFVREEIKSMDAFWTLISERFSIPLELAEKAFYVLAYKQIHPFDKMVDIKQNFHEA
jgi:arylamine N-acetyltransferase